MKLAKRSEESLNNQPEYHGEEKKPKKHISKKFVVAGSGLILGVILALTVNFIIFNSQIVQEQERQLDQISQQKANLARDAVENYFKNTVDKVNFFASQPSLSSAIVADDSAALENVKKTIRRQIKNVEAVHFFANDEAQLNADFFPPIRFSELSLIQKAEKGEAANVEAVKIDNNWLLHIIVPARSSADSQINGVVWICLGTQGLKPVLQKDNKDLGEIALYQNFNKNSRPLVLKVGSGSLGNIGSSRISDTQWEVQFTAATGLASLTHVNTSFTYLLMAIIFVVLVAGLAGLGLAIGNKLDIAAGRKKIEGQMRSASGQSQSDELVDPMYQSKSLFDVQIAKEDESLLGMDDDEASPGKEGDLSLDDDVFDIGDDEHTDSGFAPEVFRAYDIRGLADEQIDKEFALALGQALGSEILEQRDNTIVVARDARTHSPQLTEWLVRGILSTGCSVLNIGTVPTPLMYFTIETMEEVSSGVMVTASHNAAKYNGFKLVVNGVTRSEEDIQGIRRRMNAKKFLQGQGQEHHHDIVSTYIDAIFSDVALAGEMSVVIDAGNGVAGKVAPKLFEELGCRVTPLYCDLDGTFPNHDPDPSVEANLQDLIAKVQESRADIGIALDGDGDRLAVVSKRGKVYWADRLLMLFASDIISRSPGSDVIFDVKSTRHLNACIANNGGRPVMWKTGHSLMKQKMVETGAVVGAEYSGHIFIKDRWFGFDDGMYAAARLLEILSLQGEDIDEAFEAYPESLSTPEIRVPVDESRKFNLIEELKEKGDFGEGRLTLLDGIRADYPFGWGLVRASNTGAELTLRFEADDEASLHKLKSIFVKELHVVDSSIEINWNQ